MQTEGRRLIFGWMVFLCDFVKGAENLYQNRRSQSTNEWDSFMPSVVKDHLITKFDLSSDSLIVVV